MGEARLLVDKAGPMITIQDAGRSGHMRFGVCASGPMDRFSHACANAAIGRPAGSPVIEISAGGITLVCTEGEVSVAIAGAAPIVTVNDVRLSAWCVTTLRQGDRLSVRAGNWGSFSYLSFAGDLECSYWLESAATHLLAGFGGGSLQNGDEIRVSSTQVLPGREGPLPIPELAQALEQVKVVAGPQDSHFTEESVMHFLSEKFTLSIAYDRMGVRLQGPTLSMGDALSIPSEPLVRGSVQVSGDGSPTVLLADHQTTGGYPKIATVISVDTDRLVQLRSGQTISFIAVTPEEAIVQTRAVASARARYLDQMTSQQGSLEYRLMQQNLITGVTTGTDSY